MKTFNIQFLRSDNKMDSWTIKAPTLARAWGTIVKNYSQNFDGQTFPVAIITAAEEGGDCYQWLMMEVDNAAH